CRSAQPASWISRSVPALALATAWLPRVVFAADTASTQLSTLSLHDALPISPVIYSMADALMLPSTFESVGLPVLEAMAAGCPVLTSNRCGTKELAEGAACLVDPDSVGSIASGLERLLRDAEERARLIAAGRDRAAQFTWSLTARKVLDVLENIAQV